MEGGNWISLIGYAAIEIAELVAHAQILSTALIAAGAAFASFLIANTIGPILGTYATEAWFKRHQQAHQALIGENALLRQQSLKLQGMTESAADLISELRAENAALLERALKAELAVKLLAPPPVRQPAPRVLAEKNR